MSGAAAIALHDVSKSFQHEGRARLALAGVDLTVAQGEFVSIIGPSGCGKTTLLKVIGGLLEPSAGTVAVGGLDPREAQRRKAIGFVFQDPALLPWRTVGGNIMLPLQVNRRDARGARQPGDLIDLVGLADFSDYYPHQLSGGMKQRVALARALVFDPALLLMDEPLGALDEITRAAMRYELLRIWEARRKTVVMVTHSVAEAVILSDRVVVLNGQPGRVASETRIDLPRPRPQRLERSPAFLDHVDRVQEMMASGGWVGAANALSRG